MFRLAPRVAAVLLGTLFAGPLAGCTALTAMADAEQKPPVSTYAIKASQDKTFTSAVQAMGGFGKLLSQDKASGVVQGQKGNWMMTATVGEAVDSTRLQLSARYVPSQQMDFYSRDGLTAEFITLLEASLGEKVVPPISIPSETILTGRRDGLGGFAGGLRVAPRPSPLQFSRIERQSV